MRMARILGKAESSRLASQSGGPFYFARKRDGYPFRLKGSNNAPALFARLFQLTFIDRLDYGEAPAKNLAEEMERKEREGGKKYTKVTVSTIIPRLRAPATCLGNEPRAVWRVVALLAVVRFGRIARTKCRSHALPKPRDIPRRFGLVHSADVTRYNA